MQPVPRSSPTRAHASPAGGSNGGHRKRRATAAPVQTDVSARLASSPTSMGAASQRRRVHRGQGACARRRLARGQAPRRRRRTLRRGSRLVQALVCRRLARRRHRRSLRAQVGLRSLRATAGRARSRGRSSSSYDVQLARVAVAFTIPIGIWSVFSIFTATQEIARAFLASSAVLAVIAGLALTTPLGNLGRACSSPSRSPCVSATGSRSTSTPGSSSIFL